MENVEKIREAFTETYIILNDLNLYNRLPNDFKKLIEFNYTNDHKFSFNKDIPLFKQVDNSVTRNLITYIYINYIDKDNKQFFENEINSILYE